MIIPAILTDNFETFKNQAEILSFSPLLQIDVMDGVFVSGHSFLEIEKINSLNLESELELHLMVSHPLAEIKKWQEVKKVKRIIFHVESEDSPKTVIDKINGLGYEAGIAINPETDFHEILPLLNSLKEVLFMTVNPGKQGSPFIDTMFDKIKNFKKIADSKEIDILIGADGAISKENIAELKKCGVENFCIGSAIVKSTDAKKSYDELNQLI